MRGFCCSEGAPAPSAVQLVMDTASGKNRGYAFVTYDSRAAAAEAVEALNDKELQEKKIRVSVKQTKVGLYKLNAVRRIA